jgi:two-component system, chemotaxis family, CheB/CheR fusion protein
MNIEERATRVLIVDDDADMRDLLSQFLRNEWSCVKAFESGEAALQSFSRDVPTVVVLDINLSAGMDGYEFAERARAAKIGGGLWLIATTGQSRADVRANGDVFDAVFTKPVELGQLAKEMRRLVTPRPTS